MGESDDDRLLALLREDVPFGDLTTSALAIGTQAAEASFAARGAMVVAGIEEAKRLFELCDAQAQVLQPSGTHVDAGTLLLAAEGDAAALLMAWKTAQTLAEAMSGIATALGRIVGALAEAGFTLPVACTRKSFPGTRAWAAKAVRAGGGIMHRAGLSETLLLFPEHMAFVPAAEQAAAVARVRRAQPEKRVVVEVGSHDVALAMARAGADVLQLERFAPASLRSLREALAAEALKPLLAPAGGVTAANAVDYARAGADFLVTSAPYFAPPADIQVRIGPRSRA